MVRRWLATGLAGVALVGCSMQHAATRPHATVETATPQPEWMQIATPAGLRSLDTLDARFARAINSLSRASTAKAVAEGALLDPQAAQLAPQLSPGPYHCRLIRLGGARGVQSFAPDVCYILADKDGVAFSKSTGENRPEGYLYLDGDKRMVLLGTYRRVGEKARYRYGQDSSRDLVGLVERVSAFRWRVILDRAAGGGASLDVYEMVPVPPEVKGAKPMVPAT
ncbi:MAG: DUF4893 domain-containing protein [Candidatus Sphingomonas colombiensis]|nr:DUF4893 domain-containing protein [Sphingomonas sp.]WEK43074.1 MAG: DUF4893 domain-containing protein [Sphingomonas sp.]